MSLQHCSLALDETSLDSEIETPLTLVVNKRYDLMTNGFSGLSMTQNEVIELGGTITVSF